MQTKVEELEMYNSVEASTLRTGVQMKSYLTVRMN